MKALLYESFQSTPKITKVKDPTPSSDGVVIEVKATGLCRSDWHGWMGHDEDIELPHVPGHEFSGIISAIGKDVKNWNIGDRVSVPFVCACGTCPECASGNHQVCDAQFQPGFTHWGSFAEYVAIDRADVNLVALPEQISFETAASLGCRFATSFRAVVAQGKVTGGQWLAVHGCGGVGLSAIMIANALGANVIAIDIDEEKLKLAKSIGAVYSINSLRDLNPVEQIIEITKGGVHVSIDALGSPTTSFNSIANLRKRGKHIQVGLMLGDDKHAAVPMNQILSKELEIYGSHGMQAYKYPEMLEMILQNKMNPELLIGQHIRLDQAIEELTEMNKFKGTGITIINSF
ncbi:zinc-dependent alcohol dehydrogenase family protein [Algoriphagus halophilus]|uniref:Alcohol dehydrogenase n=1 Tax=Algoriphagus halophilus TaxID=226505 RepID=A0A1N6DCF1_9BACT|nr:zinc-dependent alcohol dehydrogenase family protein [Algoriphagus halophilus]SIN68498.1 alcohol dehydrogenase [Algoriphagus halophilus]